MSLHDTATHVQTGCVALDKLLEGGFRRGELTLAYGEAATGKTNLALQASAETARTGGKVIYVDVDQSFTYQRFHQIAPDFEEQSHNIVIFIPEFFVDQTRIFENLEKYLIDATRLIVVDAVTTLYRAILATTDERFVLNRELNRQLAYLTSLANIHNIAVFITSQVHARLGAIAGIEPVARRTLFHWPRTIIRLESTLKKNIKRAVLERGHSMNPSNMMCYLTLTERGFE
jgi:DNA repair protein RadB